MADDENTEVASSARRYWSEEGYTAGGVIREVDYAKASRGLLPELQGIKIVDCDTHITESPDLFTSRAPAKFKDKVPYRYQVKGVDRWCVQGRDFGSFGGNVIRKDNNKILGRPEKSKILTRTFSYHGVCIATTSMTGLPSCTEPFGLPLPGFVHVPGPHAYGVASEMTPEEYGDFCLAETARVIDREGADTIAASSPI